jgi:molecular chaperone DnaK (HSP70)
MGLGIDFGTTRTVVAWADRGNYPVVSFESDTGDAVEWFPSIVAERAGELRFGFEALAVARDASFTQARSFKRLLADAKANGTVRLGASELSIGELVARFIGALAGALRSSSNLPASLRKSARFEAVVATPANAFCTQRFLTLEAFRRAGFDVRAMLNEPSAAGFEFSHRHARTLNSRREHVIVYDLGGGTFDASLVRVSGKHHEVVTTAGLGDLGGDDFDRVLADLALERLGLSWSALSAQARVALLDGCRDAKERLHSSSRKITLDLDACLGAQAPESDLALSAADYFEACAPLVERTLEAMTPVVERGEHDGTGALADVAGVYVVGGASALPVVSRLLKTRFGRRVHRSPYPHAAVAIGLAIASDSAAGFELDDRFSRNFGVFREASRGERASYDPIFTRDMALPKIGQAPVAIERTYRPAHDIGHFRFFECASFDADGCPSGVLAPITELFFPFDPGLRSAELDLARRPVRRLSHEGPLTRERYAFDAQGMVRVTITDLECGFERTTVIGA